jgi:hypothetical protein
MGNVTLPTPVALAGGAMCLSGDAVTEQEGATEGRLCGTWRRTEAGSDPDPGDSFRFVSMVVDRTGADEQDPGRSTLIYGDVVR